MCIHARTGQWQIVPDVIFGIVMAQLQPFRHIIDGFMAELASAIAGPSYAGVITKHCGTLHGPTYALQIEMDRHSISGPHAIFDDRLNRDALQSLGHTITDLTAELTKALSHLSAAQ